MRTESNMLSNMFHEKAIRPAVLVLLKRLMAFRVRTGAPQIASLKWFMGTDLEKGRPNSRDFFFFTRREHIGAFEPASEKSWNIFFFLFEQTCLWFVNSSFWPFRFLRTQQHQAAVMVPKSFFTFPAGTLRIQNDKENGGGDLDPRLATYLNYLPISLRGLQSERKFTISSSFPKTHQNFLWRGTHHQLISMFYLFPS